MSNFDNVSSSLDVEEDPRGSDAAKAKMLKFCGVCGDKAKGMHFGGVCCDSCKAFFRRSVQNGVFEAFFCSGSECCVIDRSNRKDCQYCRFQKCKANGMEPSWVMTEEDRKGLLARRLERRKLRHIQKQQVEQQYRQEPQTLIDGSLDPPYGRERLDSETGGCISGARTEGDGKMTELQSLWQSAFDFQELPDHVSGQNPKNAEHLFDLVRKCVERFIRSVPEFDAVCERDQEILLENGIPPASILYCAHQFDPQRNAWPKNLHSRCKVPVLSCEALRNFIWDESTYDQFMRFFAKFSRDLNDEGVVLLLLLIVLFNPDEPQLQEPKVTESVQTKFTMLLQEQLTGISSPTLPKLIMRLTDVRHLAEFLDSRLTSSANTSNVNTIPFRTRFDSSSETLHPKKLFMKRSKIQSRVLDDQPQVSSSTSCRDYAEYNGTCNTIDAISPTSSALRAPLPMSAIQPIETGASSTTTTKQYPWNDMPSSGFFPGITPSLDHKVIEEEHDGPYRNERCQQQQYSTNEADFSYPYNYHPGRRTPPQMYTPHLSSSLTSRSSSSGENISYNGTSYLSQPSCSSTFFQPSATGRQEPSPSPVGNMCHEFDRLHAEPIAVYPEDARVLEAARDILPPHLLRQLAKKLQNMPRKRF